MNRNSASLSNSGLRAVIPKYDRQCNKARHGRSIILQSMKWFKNEVPLRESNMGKTNFIYMVLQNS